MTNAPPGSLPDMEAKAKALEPQLVRIFYNDNWEERLPTAPENMASFIRTVQLAHDSGATINITYHTASVARLNPVPSMTRFAAVLEDLVVTRGLTNVRWVTVQNEPNTATAALTLEQYNALYRALDAQLVARGLRDHLKLMGGDLIESTGARHQTIWFEYIEQNMSDVLDAYSVHIYWNYFDIPRMEFRLKDIRRIVTEEIAPEAQKPVYIMEFGVRGLGTAAGKPPLSFAYWEDGTEMRKTNVAAFQQLWFNIASAQLGYTGTSKWDAFWGLYDNSSPGNQSYWMIGTAEEGWPVFPTYHALQLLLSSTEPGWQVVQVAPWNDDDWKLGIAGPGGEGDRRVCKLRRRPDAAGTRHARAQPECRLRREPGVQHRRPASEYDVQPGVVERDRQRRGRRRRHGHDRRRRRGPLRGAAARGVLADHGSGLARAGGAVRRAPSTRRRARAAS